MESPTTSTHPVSPSTVEQVRDALTRAFADAIPGLEGTPAVEVVIGDDGLGATRTATAEDGRLVLHETTSGLGEARRTTIALTGSTVYGERFWLGATSYDGAPVERLELDGDLPSFVAPVLGQVLIALRR